ncbi:MAG: pyrophosphate--fructose 6-phosphate 1-phosphotransferase [Chloroflexota bacterium]|nr:MAG: pyrophosphate--fructose 6-phosphate 1-phosphotransferase [Chloroflexota bacterium]
MSGVFVIGQSGGPTAVLNTSLAGFIGGARRAGASVFGLAHGLEGALNDSFLDLNGLDENTLERLAVTPGAALGSSRRKLDEDEYTRVLAAFRRRGVTGFAYCGGNGSMWVAHRLSLMARDAGYDLRVIGIPKTVDNDLNGTDHAPGYGSAARFLALAARDTGLDLEAMTTFDDAVILEAMGRDAGWLAAASALLKKKADDAPHLVYVPEIIFDDERFLQDVAAVHRRLNRVYIVVGEGVRYADGAFVGSSGDADMLGRTIHGLIASAGLYLARLVRERLGLQTRFFRPGNIGRALSACVSEVDRAEARQVGDYAAQALARGEHDSMVALKRHEGGSETHPYGCEVGTIALDAVAGQHRPLPRACINETGNMVTPAFVEYALPLIGDVPPVMRLPSPFRDAADRNLSDNRT